MIIRNYLGALGLGLCASMAFAGGAVDFSLSDDSLRLEHDAVLLGSGAHFTTGGLYNEAKENWAITASFNAVDPTMANQELIGGVGFKALLVSTEAADLALSAAVGGFLRWHPDFMNGLGLEGQAYYAPSILSFGDLTSAYDVVARVSYKILPQARLFVGFHELAGDYDDVSNVKVDSTFHVGFRITY